MKWKKYDSGSYNRRYSDSIFSRKISYVTYIRGSKEIRLTYYGYYKKNNRKIAMYTHYFSKKGDLIKKHSIIHDGKKI